MRWFLRASWALLLRDWRVRFRRTALGALWFLLPLLSMVAAALYLGEGSGLYDARAPGGRAHHAIRLLAGLMLWQVFAQAWLEPLRLSRRAATLLRAVPFDARVLLGAGSLSALAAFVLRLPVLAVSLGWAGVSPASQAWLLPVGLVALLACGAALACVSLPLGLALHDVRYALPVLQFGWLLVTPVFHDPVTGGWLERLNRFNPLAALVPPLRDALTGQPSDGMAIMPATVFAWAVLMLGLAYYRVRIRLAVAYVGR